LLEFFLPTGVSPVLDPVRELTEASTPYRDVFRVAAGVSGLAFLLSGPPLVRMMPVHWASRLSAASASLLGMLMLVDAAYPGIAGIDLLTNLVFVVGTGSLVLWWPRGWRSVAIAGLVMALATWLAMLVLMLLGPGHFIGIVSRVQMLGRALILAVAASYLLQRHLPRVP
jgi:cell shape-determining protein MreD